MRNRYGPAAVRPRMPYMPSSPAAPDLDEERVERAARARGVAGVPRRAGLILGYASPSERAIADGVTRLAAAIRELRAKTSSFIPSDMPDPQPFSGIAPMTADLGGEV